MAYGRRLRDRLARTADIFSPNAPVLTASANETKIDHEQPRDGEEKPIRRNEIHAEASDWRAAQHAERVEHDKGRIALAKSGPL